MPIVFEQPGPYSQAISSAYGAAQALKDFAPYLYRAYPGGGGGGGGGSRGGGGGGGARGLPGDSGGYGGGGGNSQTDPLALYAAKQQLDQYFAKQQQDQAVAAIQDNTADAAPDQSQIDALQKKQDDSDFPTYDEAGTGYVPGTPNQEAQGPVQPAANADVQNADGSISANSGNWRGQPQSGATVAPGQAGPNTPGAAPPPPEFTQSDALQLQRLNAAKSRVQAQLQSGMVDPGTARRMIQQIQSGINPLHAAQAAAQQQSLQQQTAQIQHQAAMQTQIENMNDAERSKWIGKRTVRLPNGAWGYVDRNGDIKPLPQEHLDRAAQAQAQAAQASDRDRTRRIAISNQVESSMAREATAIPPPAWARSEQGRREERARRIRQRLREAEGNIEGGDQQPSQRTPSPESTQRLNERFGTIAMPPMAQPQQQQSPTGGITRADADSELQTMMNPPF